MAIGTISYNYKTKILGSQKAHAIYINKHHPLFQHRIELLKLIETLLHPIGIDTQTNLLHHTELGEEFGIAVRKIGD